MFADKQRKYSLDILQISVFFSSFRQTRIILYFKSFALVFLINI